MEDKCLRCGICCHYVINGKIKKCKFLMKVGKDKYFCRIYPNRLGKILDSFDDKVIKCINRKDSPIDYPNCPYNKDNQIAL